MSDPIRRIARCACGQVEVEGSGEPIVSLVCYCDDCQAGGHLIEAMANAQPVLDPDGGSSSVLYRKDRFRIVRGEERLAGIRNRPDSQTERVVATCCNTAMFMRFDQGGPFWIPIYRNRLGQDAPPLEMRVSTRFAPDPAAIPMDVPQHRGIAPRFALRLVLAYASMVLRR